MCIHLAVKHSCVGRGIETCEAMYSTSTQHRSQKGLQSTCAKFAPQLPLHDLFEERSDFLCARRLVQAKHTVLEPLQRIRHTFCSFPSFADHLLGPFSDVRRLILAALRAVCIEPFPNHLQHWQRLRTCLCSSVATSVSGLAPSSCSIQPTALWGCSSRRWC